LSLRVIPDTIPTPEELLVPDAVAQICDLPQGFVLVTGPAGSGKSTTLASLIDRINRRKPVHILTIEDPIEYVHNHKMAAVCQREVGLDTTSFEQALRSAVREDPDVILVGEMRDPETIQFALTLAETGHLVFATLHTSDTQQALDRICDVFARERQTQIRVQLAACLAAAVSQRLVPKVCGGVVAAFEVLLATPAVRDTVREGKSCELRDVMRSCRAEGMQTLESGLNDLVVAGIVSYEEALSSALHPEEIHRPLRDVVGATHADR
jgi:twitching motility protein PilT